MYATTGRPFYRMSKDEAHQGSEFHAFPGDDPTLVVDPGENAPALSATELRRRLGLPEGDAIEDYGELHTIGLGGMGAVFSGREPGLMREVALKMLRPADGKEGVTKFIVDTVKNAGGNPCPPTVVGIGLGGTMEMCAILAKRALLRPLGQRNADPRYAAYEEELLHLLNSTGVGPQGLGGSVSCLDVHIEAHPCHLASLPVAVNLNCHAARHAEAEI